MLKFACSFVSVDQNSVGFTRLWGRSPPLSPEESTGVNSTRSKSTGDSPRNLLYTGQPLNKSPRAEIRQNQEKNMANRSRSVNGSSPHSAQPVNYTPLAELLPLAVFIVLVNSLVVALFAKRPRLRTPQNHFLLGLAVSDLLTGLLNIPLVLVFFLCPPPCDSTPQFLRFLLPVCHNFSAVLAAYQILAITAERFSAIRRPLQHRSFGKKRARWLLAAIWLVSAAIAFSQFLFYGKPVDPEPRQIFQLVHSIFCIVAVFLLPFTFMIFAHCVMFKTISLSGSFAVNESKRLQEEHYEEKARRDRKCLIIFATMAAIYAVCWLPWFVVTVLINMMPFGWVGGNALGKAPQIFAIVRYLSSIINPIIYTFFKRDFQAALKGEVLGSPDNNLSRHRTRTTSENISMRKREHKRSALATPNGERLIDNWKREGLVPRCHVQHRFFSGLGHGPWSLHEVHSGAVESVWMAIETCPAASLPVQQQGLFPDLSVVFTRSTHNGTVTWSSTRNNKLTIVEDEAEVKK